MDIKCSKCGEILIRNVNSEDIARIHGGHVHLCRVCLESLGVDICDCGRLMEVSNAYILNECSCGVLVRKQNI